jgi:hypothetical protein
MELGSAASAKELGRFYARRYNWQRAGEAYLRAWTIDDGVMPRAWLELIEQHLDADGARAALAIKRFLDDNDLQRLAQVLDSAGDRAGATAARARMQQAVEPSGA